LCLHSQIGHNAEAYVDDIVVKTREEGLISDMAEIFDNLSKFKMKLDPKKYTFNVPSGKLLGYMVSRHDIDSNPEKVSAITKMKPPESLRDVQKLTGCMATLSRFINSTSSDSHSLSSSRNMISYSGLRRHKRPLKT
jgi:hypothetical protein